MFIRTRNFDEYINSDDIVRLREKYFKTDDGRKIHSFLAILRDGTSVEMGSDMDEAVTQTMSVIAAAPGYEALYAFEDESAAELTFDVIRHPVLGWRVSPYGGLIPVLLDEMDDAPVTIRYPDGRVVIPADTTYENEEAWLKGMYKREMERRAGKAVA